MLLVIGLVQPRILHAEPIQTKILALYDGEIDSDPFYTRTHAHAEVILNHLGMEVRYHDIRKPLPKLDSLKDYRGMISWFGGNNLGEISKSYCRWLEDWQKAGKKIVILGDFGFLNDDTTTPRLECRGIVDLLNMEVKGFYSDNPILFKVESKDSEMVEFERKINFVENDQYFWIKNNNKNSKNYLKISRKDIADSTSDLVFTTSWGGYVGRSYAVFENKILNKLSWKLNPFLFFEEAFALEGLPRPDTTTLNGKRISYAHIDGDGMVNVSKVDQKSFSGEIILEKILKKFPDIPTTVSVITRYLELPEYKGERIKSFYKELFGLQNVEPAAHGYAHPFNWKAGRLAFDIPGYHYNAQKEIVGSLQMMNDLFGELGISKEVKLFLWTGDCLLDQSAFDVIGKYNILNMNGGDSRFDQKYNSYAFAYPLGLYNKNGRQIYSSFPNENIYTNLWEGPYYGFIRIIESFENLGKPRRIKPVNLYYHFYSGERLASLNTLEQIYTYIQKSDFVDMFATEYVNIANDFFETKIEKFNDTYSIKNHGYLKTIRFDGIDKFVDLEKSKGVLGYEIFQNSLYVHLDGSGDYQLQMSSKPYNDAYLVSANFRIKDMALSKKKVSFLRYGWGKTNMILANMFASRKYKITYGKWEFVRSSDEMGNLEINFGNGETKPGYKKVDIEVETF